MRGVSQRSTPALWLPTIWLLVSASRPVGRWLDGGAPGDPGGSVLDQLVLGVLISAAVIVLCRRRAPLSSIVQGNAWLLVLFAYLGISIVWSDIPFVSLKRWVRACGDPLMALVVLTELSPLYAMETVLYRCAYVLVPVSAALIKYVPALGRSYGRWNGEEMWTGVATHKSSLGPLCAVAAIFLTWSLLRRWRAGMLGRHPLRTACDLVVLAVALTLLRGPAVYFSATSLGMFFVSLGALLSLSMYRSLRAVVARHLIPMVLSLCLVCVISYDWLIDISSSMAGRDETLTGRTEMWHALINFASQNPLLGVGYGGFWAPGNRELEEIFTSQFILAQSHNGYLATYVETGLLGVMLLSFFLLGYCRQLTDQMRRNPDWALFGLCVLLMSLMYNYTESGFLQAGTLLWSVLIFMTVVFSWSSRHALIEHSRVHTLGGVTAGSARLVQRRGRGER